MRNAFGRFRALPVLGSVPALALLVVLPFLTLALLGAWYVEAERVADAESQRVAQVQNARQQASEVAQAIEDAASAKMVAVSAGFQAGAALAVRNYYLTAPVIEMVAIYDEHGNLLFPEDQELRLLGEDSVLRRDDLRLLAARRTADSLSVSWVGTIRDRDAGTVGCRVLESLTICLLLRSDELLEIAELAVDQGRIVDLAAPAPVTPTQTRAVAMLPEPLNGLGIGIDYAILSRNSWLLVAAIIAPTLLASAVAAVALLSAHRARVGAAEHRANVLSEVSHELRTPLANLRLYAELLHSHRSDGPKIDRYAAVIEEETTRLGWIVDNALTLSMNDAAPGRQMQSQVQSAVPNTVVTALIERCGPLLQDASNLDLELHTPSPLAFDVRTFEQVLLNILDNARKHAPGSKVRLRCWVSGRTLRLKVSDDGRRSEPKHDGLHGFGLGLRACATLARLAGGEFNYSLDAKGSWFSLLLPLEDTGPMIADGPSAVPA